MPALRIAAILAAPTNKKLNCSNHTPSWVSFYQEVHAFSNIDDKIYDHTNCSNKKAPKPILHTASMPDLEHYNLIMAATTIETRKISACHAPSALFCGYNITQFTPEFDYILFVVLSPVHQSTHRFFPFHLSTTDEDAIPILFQSSNFRSYAHAPRSVPECD